MLIYILPFIVTAIFCQLYEYKPDVGYKYIYGFFLLLLGLFGGFRFETAQDWDGYKVYFENIDTSYGVLESYVGDIINLRFEIGYFFINYFVKLAGFDYGVVFLLSSLFCSYSLFVFTRNFSGNKFYILIVYFSYSFLLLQFAQVRQAIALSFVLLGCSNYLKTEKKAKSMVIALLGLFFQFSSLIYTVMLGFVLYYPNKVKYHIILAILIIPLFLLFTQFYELFYIIKLLVPGSLEGKVDYYQNEVGNQGIGQLLYGGYLLICIAYITYYFRTLTSLNSMQVFIFQYAILSLTLTIMAIFLFQGNYVMYSRVYLIASIFQGFAISIILDLRRSILHKIFLNLSIVIAFGYYFRIINNFYEEYIPYRSWISAFFF